MHPRDMLLVMWLTSTQFWRTWIGTWMENYAGSVEERWATCPNKPRHLRLWYSV